MPLTGEMELSPTGWVRTHTEKILEKGTTDGTTINGMPIILLTTRGAKTGKLRKVPLMRVEHDGVYAAIASQGGAPDHPTWYHNFLAHPLVDLQDGPEPKPYVARVAEGEERDRLWRAASSMYPGFDVYQERAASRRIPVVVCSPRR